jgi:hypothetical protein
MSNKKDTIEEMEAMRKTIETMQTERDQREIEHRSEIEARDLQIAEANSRALTAEQNLASNMLLYDDQALNDVHRPTQTDMPGKFFIEHNNFDYNNKHVRLYIMRKLKLLLSRNAFQRFQRRRE